MRAQKLGEFIEKWHVKKDDWEGSNKLEVLGVSNVDGITVTSHKKSKDLSKYLVIEPNCFAYNPYRINVGSIGLTPEEIYGLVSPAYTVFKVKENKLIPELLLDFLKSFDGLQQINKYARGTVRKALRYDDLCEIKVNFPSYEEQKKIFNKKLLVETKQVELSDEIQTQKQLISKLKQAILQEAIQGKLTQEWREKNQNIEPASKLLERIKAEKEQLIKDKKIRKEKPLPPITEEEIPFEIPESWVWCRLGEISNQIHYGFNASAKPSKRDVRLLRITDIQNNSVIWENVPGCDYSEKDIENYSLKENDIVIARTGGTIGKSYIVKNISVKSLFASYLIRVIPNTNYNADYLKLFIDSPIYWKQLYDMAWGAGQPNVNGTSLKSLKLPLPPLEEQKAIVEKVETLMQKCNALEQEITQSEQHANMLMQAVLKEAFESKTENTEVYANANTFAE